MILRCYPRIHVGLIDMGGATPRSYGGAGFTINSLPIEISVECGLSNRVNNVDKLDAQGQRDLSAALNRLFLLFPETKGAEITIARLPPQHIGLGTKTSFLLGTIAAVSKAFGLKISRQQLQLISGRGGASGVGINTFFTGGFLADAGHCTTHVSSLVPSSARKPVEIPPIICRSNIPRVWGFYLILPAGKRFYGSSEREFFSNNYPIPRTEVLRTLAYMYHGIVPAVLTQDLVLLKQSIEGVHNTGFKKRELAAQSENVQRIISDLRGLQGCAVGLSSMGPLVYVIANRHNHVVYSKVRQVCELYNADLLDICGGRNRSYEVIK